MRNVRWVIQENLIAEDVIGDISNVCEELNVSYQPVKVIPFTDELPEFTLDNNTNIYYGSTTFINKVYEELNHPFGLFFDENEFLMENYLNKWGKFMLSSEARVITIGEFMYEDHPLESQWFIRPNDDLKSFDGDIKMFCEVEAWFDATSKLYNNVDLTENTKILVGSAYNIKKEWRNYIVDGKVVSSSRYRENFRLSKSNTDIPEDMIKFVEDRCAEYVPHKVFAMDVGLCGDEYYIIECGCIHSVGFYDADIYKIFKEITKWVQNN